MQTGMGVAGSVLHWAVQPRLMSSAKERVRVFMIMASVVRINSDQHALVRNFERVVEVMREREAPRVLVSAIGV